MKKVHMASDLKENPESWVTSCGKNYKTLRCLSFNIKNVNCLECVEVDKAWYEIRVPGFIKHYKKIKVGIFQENFRKILK